MSTKEIFSPSICLMAHKATPPKLIKTVFKIDFECTTCACIASDFLCTKMSSQTLLQKDLGLCSPKMVICPCCHLVPRHSVANELMWGQSCRRLPISHEDYTPGLGVTSTVIQPTELYLTRTF